MSFREAFQRSYDEPYPAWLGVLSWALASGVMVGTTLLIASPWAFIVAPIASGASVFVFGMGVAAIERFSR